MRIRHRRSTGPLCAAAKRTEKIVQQPVLKESQNGLVMRATAERRRQRNRGMARKPLLCAGGPAGTKVTRLTSEKRVGATGEHR